MGESGKVLPAVINKRQVLIGVAVLVIGTFFYLVGRPPEQTYFVSITPVNISLYGTVPNLFGVVGDSLPSFVHVFSFILITAGMICCHRRGYLIICLCWFLVECAFELGQKFDAWCLGVMPDWFAGIPFLENIENYFLQGTFDVVDVIAILAGTSMAYFVLVNTERSTRRAKQ